MKEVLIDVVRQAASQFDKVRISGSNTGTKAEAYTDDKMLFLFAELTDVVPEFFGEFGMSNLQLLRGLLDFATYKADNSMKVHRIERDGQEFVAELEFKDAERGVTRFKTINPRMIGDRASVKPINWDVSVTPSKAKLTEVMQLTSMLAQVDQRFSVFYEDRTLFLEIGGSGAASHNAKVALATDVDCKSLPTKSFFKAPHFLSVLKSAGKPTISFSKDGLCGISVETEHGAYNYILRGTDG